MMVMYPPASRYILLFVRSSSLLIVQALAMLSSSRFGGLAEEYFGWFIVLSTLSLNRDLPLRRVTV